MSAHSSACQTVSTRKPLKLELWIRSFITRLLRYPRPVSFLLTYQLWRKLQVFREIKAQERMSCQLLWHATPISFAFFRFPAEVIFDFRSSKTYTDELSLKEVGVHIRKTARYAFFYGFALWTGQLHWYSETLKWGFIYFFVCYRLLANIFGEDFVLSCIEAILG